MTDEEPNYLVTVHIIVKANSHIEVHDAMSALLTQDAMVNGKVYDWCYTTDNTGRYSSPQRVHLGENYTCNEDDLIGVLKKGSYI